jgi:hypothetical protein
MHFKKGFIMKKVILNQVSKDILSLKISEVVLFNSQENENILLKDAIIENLCINLIEQDCSSNSSKVYDWLLEDYKNCVSEEDFVRLTEQQYTKKGELEYNNVYDFDVEY